MGYSRLSPVSKHTAGIGPAIDRRRATRAGPDGATAAGAPAAGFGRRAPNKKPAALALQVPVIDDSLGGEPAFRGGSDADVHRLDAAGGGACVADGYRVGFDHSLLQGTSAGRNLITVFSTVNNRRANFFRAIQARRRGRPGVRVGVGDPAHRQHPALPQASGLHANAGAALSGCGDFLSSHLQGCAGSARRAGATPRGRGRPRAGDASKRIVFALHKSVCAKTARTFPADRGDGRATRRRKNAEPATSPPRVPWITPAAKRVSGLRPRAARRSRPGRAVR